MAPMQQSVSMERGRATSGLQPICMQECSVHVYGLHVSKNWPQSL